MENAQSSERSDMGDTRQGIGGLHPKGRLQVCGAGDRALSQVMGKEPEKALDISCGSVLIEENVSFRRGLGIQAPFAH
jgi:hypothetical protein